MQVSQNFIAREVAGEYLLIPTGAAALETKGLIALSESGYFLFQLLQEDHTEDALVEAMRGEYDAPEEVIRADVAAFLQQMRDVQVLEEAGE